MRLIFFITHRTLGISHAEMCLKHLSLSKNPISFDKMYIYNSHSDELRNEDLLQLCESFNLKRFISEIEVFPYDISTGKTLGDDVSAIKNYLCEYPQDTQILLLKSDICVSTNLLNDFMKVESNFVFTPAFITAKEKVTDIQIDEYLQRELVILSDDVTYFLENETQSLDNDIRNRPRESPLDSKFNFISCTTKRDFSCHYLTLNMLNLIDIASKSWGGVNLQPTSNYWVGSNRGFTVHKYHNIVSENRTEPRQGPIEEIFKSI